MSSPRVKCKREPNYYQFKHQKKKNNNNKQWRKYKSTKKPRKKEQDALIRAKKRLAKAEVADVTRVTDEKKSPNRKKITIQQIFKKYSMERVNELWKPSSTELCRDLYEYALDLHQKKNDNV